jgi:3,4-dihydroxyphthalate decarboxylase
MIATAGGELGDLPTEDKAELPALGGAFDHGTAWRHELARLG